MKRVLMILALFATITVVGFGCVRVQSNQPQQTTKEIDRSAILLDAKQQGLIMDTGETEHMKDPSVLLIDERKESEVDTKNLLGLEKNSWRAAALADVTGGSSYGLAHARFENGSFTLVAVLGGLPAPSEQAVYRGWLVKRSDGMKVVDVGPVQQIDGQFVNAYVSKQDLSIYDFYVVTLQNNASDSVPGEHILEGAIH